MGTAEGAAPANFSAAYAWNLQKLQTQHKLNGAGTVIAILDTGIIHPTLPNVDYVDCFQDSPPCADYPNTTHAELCACTILGFNGVYGVVYGVAPCASVIIYRVAKDVNSYIAEAVIYALDNIGMRIDSGRQIDAVSISSDYGNFEEARLKEIEGKIEALCRRGVVFLAAVGNRGKYQTRPSHPACLKDCVLSVGAQDKDGYESTISANAHVDIFAPGEGVRSPWSGDVQYEGTSFATPAAAGLILLLKQCANKIGGATKDNIHRIEVLRKIFENMKSESSKGEMVLDPEGFFDRLLNKDENFLKNIVEPFLAEQ
jgi:subtilisin family serine protease